MNISLFIKPFYTIVLLVNIFFSKLISFPLFHLPKLSNVIVLLPSYSLSISSPLLVCIFSSLALELLEVLRRDRALSTTGLSLELQ